MSKVYTESKVAGGFDATHIAHILSFEDIAAGKGFGDVGKTYLVVETDDSEQAPASPKETNDHSIQGA